MQHVKIWTDGACWPNPGGSGSWAAILVYETRERTVSGFVEDTTNNRMEIAAAIEAIKCLKRPCQVTIYSDSQYLVNTMSKNWKKKKNTDLWDELVKVCETHQVTWQWVKGHADDDFNNRVDQLCADELWQRGVEDGSKFFR